MRALINNIKNVSQNKRLEGASTITQQVAKEFLLTNEVSMKRKIKEAILALGLKELIQKKNTRALFKSDLSRPGNIWNSSCKFRIF